jgi:hypothetical protein
MAVPGPAGVTRGRLLAALAASLAAHGVLLASVTPPPRTQPRYVILETRLAVPEAAKGSDYLTARAFNFPLAPGVQGPVTPQSPTPPKKDAVRALADITLPHNLPEAREFAPGRTAEPRRLRSLEVPLPEAVRYFKASELDVLAEPQTPIAFDRLRFAAERLGRAALRLRVFIDEAGAVNDVRFESATDMAAFEEEVRREFLGTRFFPALRQGRAVKSQKLIELYSATG